MPTTDKAREAAPPVTRRLAAFGVAVLEDAAAEPDGAALVIMTIPEGAAEPPATADEPEEPAGVAPPMAFA